MQEYVAGFAFSKDFSRVVLIRKERPAWQKGLLNAVGGHVEQSDSTHDHAMIREWVEETGTESPIWHPFARISEEGEFSVTFFCAVGDIEGVQTTTDEEVLVVSVAGLRHCATIENLPWLIPLALDFIHDKRPVWTEVTYPHRNAESNGSSVASGGSKEVEG